MRIVQRLIALTALAGLSLGAAATPLGAEELAVGTLVTSANIDEAKTKTFGNKTLGELIPGRMEWQIRNHNATMRLAAPVPKYADPYLKADTKRYAGSVRVDPSTFDISGYVAGVPFPEIDAGDSLAGLKVIWNYYYTHPQATSGLLWMPKGTFILVDGDIGIERVQIWGYKRVWYPNNSNPEARALGKREGLYGKALLYAQYPQDIRGIGTFSVRADSPKLEDVWAYIRTVRRVRRLSGGAWMDPIGGTDQLQDDLQIFNAHPTWYQGYKFVGRMPVLVIAKSAWPTWVEGAKTPAEEFPVLDVEQAPYWNLKGDYSVREVYVVETIPPVEHPYSKKIAFIDVNNSAAYYGEIYDKKGDFWKWINFASREVPDEQIAGRFYQLNSAGTVIDFQRRHATAYAVGDTFKFNPPGISEGDISLAQLEASGR